MLLTEQDTLRAISIAKANPDKPDVIAKAKAVADAYRRQQEAQGKPLFPETERARQDQATKLRSLFTDRERHGLDEDAFNQVASTFSDPEKKARFFNNQFLSSVFQKSTDEVRALGSQYRDEYAKRVWGAPVATDKEFADKLGQEFDFEDAIGKAAQESALSGAKEFEALAKFDFENVENPLYKGREAKRQELFKQAFQAVKGELAGLEPTARVFVDELKNQMGAGEKGSTLPDQWFVETVMDLPKEKRGAFLDIVARRAGEGEQKTLFQAMAERFGRQATDMVRNVGTASILRGLDEMGRQVIAGTISGQDLPEEFGIDPLNFIAGPAKAERAIKADTRNIRVPVEGSEEFAALPPEKQDALRRLERERDYLLTYEKINRIATGAIDPAESSNYYGKALLGVSSSLPNIVLAGAGPVGVALNVKSYQDQALVETIENNPGVSMSTARAMAGVQGLGQGVIDLIPAKIATGKLPGLTRWMNKAVATGKGAAGRAGIRAIGGATYEAGVELAQDVGIPGAVQDLAAALSEDIPGYDWSGHLEAFTSEESLSELIPSFLLLSFIGAGVGGVNDFKQARQLLGSYEELKTVVSSEAIAGEISSAAKAGDFDKAQSLLREEFQKTGRDAKTVQEIRVEAFPKLLQERERVRELVNRAGDLDMLPAIRNEGGGMWSLQYSDGSGLSFKSYEEADARRWQVASDENLSLHEDTVSTIRQLDAAIEAGRETKYLFSLDDPTLADMQARGDVTAEAGAQRVQIAEETTADLRREYDEATTAAGLAAGSVEDRVASARILGQSVNEFRDEVIRTTVRLYQGATPLTLIEEKTEGDAKFMIGQLGLRKWMLSSLRAWEQASGDKLFRAVGDDQLNDQDIIEAWSALTQAYFVGRSKKGDQGPVFAGSRRNIAKLLSSPLGSAMTGYARLFRAVWRRAAMIEKARRDGTFDGDLETFLARSTGISEQRLFERDVVRDGAALASQISGNVSDNAGSAPSVNDNATTFSLLPDASNLDTEFARMFSPFQRSPELRMRLGQEMLKRVLEIVQKLRPILRANRTKKDIEAERKKRQDELFSEKLDTLSPGEIAALGNQNLLEDNSLQPILSELLTEKTRTTKTGRKVRYWTGSLMSKSEAKRRGIDTTGGEWDAIPEGLPPYVWGGSLAPDQAASMFNFESPEAFFDALASEIQSRADRKAEVEAANRRIRELEREARDESRAWAEKALAERETVGTDRATLLGFLRALEAIKRALPAEVRGRIGGSVALAQLTRPAAMLDEIESRVEMIDRELERWMKAEADDRRKRLFETAKPKREAGKKPKGKAGADIHDLFDKLREALLWDGDEAEAHTSGLEARIAKGELSADAEAHAMIEANLVRLFSDWKNADAARRVAAVEAGEEVWRVGYLAEKERIAKERERRAEIRADIIAGIGTLGSRSERVAKAQKDAGLSGQWKEWFLSLFNFEQVAGFAFGAESKWTKWFSDAQREAEAKKIDEVQGVLDGLDDLFRTLGGSRLGGERLQWKLSQPSFETKAGGKMSELEGITAILMWRQEDGRRHMKGKRDEDGKLVSSWSYDEDFIAEIEANLSSDALAVMDYLTDQYASEYDTLNPIFRELNGINLPRNANYSPLSVKPQQAPGGQTTDPVTGSTMSNGSMTPGSLRTRAQVVAEPEFRNAVELFVGHKKQLAHWKAYAVFNRDAQAILGNREVGNSVEAGSGAEAVKVIRGWLDLFAQGGVRDAGAHFALSKTLNAAVGRAAAVQLVGRIGTLAVQVTQLGAAAAKMPTRAYVVRLSKLLTGNLGWGAALDSPYIQRRLAQMPPSVQVAMEGLRAGKPNAIKHAAQRLGRMIAGADALFTAGTYAMVHDYQFTKAVQAGLDPVAADQVARAEAERIVDEVAQPTRAGTRSLFESTQTGPLGKIGWAFASEARKNLALVAYSIAKRNKTEAARAIFYVTVLNGILGAVIRDAWKDLRDNEEDEDDWSAKRIILSAALEPVYGFPLGGDLLRDSIMQGAGEFVGGGTIIDTPVRAVAAGKRIASGESEDLLKDLESILTAAGIFYDNAAALASFSHLLRDSASVANNLTN